AAAGYYLDTVEHGDRQRAAAVAGADAFVAAFDRDGTPAWLRSFGGKGADTALSLAATRAGLVVVGSFEHAVRFGERDGMPHVLQSSGGRDAFVARLGDDGAVLDAIRIGGPGDDRAIAVAAAPDGGYVVLALHQGGVAIGDRRIETRGGDDGLLLRFDAEGKLLATVAIGHTGPDTWDAVTVTGEGSVWLGGGFVGSPSLEVAGRSHALRSAGSSDVVLLAFDASLREARVHTLGNAAADTLAGLVPAPGGGIYAVGSGSGTVTLGKNRHDAPGPRAWVAEFAPDGKVRASRLFAADGITQATGLAALDAGRVAVLGLFEKSLERPDGEPIEALGKTDGYVAVRTLR
ncbi:MAG TPA: hypothetical protein VFO79_03485, partial [Xanthomonadales bacterium]|nr:hypothetical protein [Xanthomonadales bacterium]